VISDPLFYAIAIPAVLLVGISKTGFGGGLGMMATPMMALTMPVPQAAAILLPILCLIDVLGIRLYWRDFDRRIMMTLLPGAVLGTLIGFATFRIVDPHWTELLVGILAVTFALWQLLRERLLKALPPSAPNAIKGFGWAALGAFTSFIAHAGGPPLSIYLLPLRLEKTKLVGVTVIFFFAVNYMKLGPYFLLGQFDATNLTTSLMLAPLAPIGVYAGRWLLARIPDQRFYPISYALLFLVGLKLIWDGAGGVG